MMNMVVCYLWRYLNTFDSEVYLVLKRRGIKRKEEERKTTTTILIPVLFSV